jgi:hypothetical protein
MKSEQIMFWSSLNQLSVLEGMSTSGDIFLRPYALTVERDSKYSRN